MYSKIVNHYKQYLKKINKNDEGKGANEPSSQNAVRTNTDPDPVSGPSGVNNEFTDPVPGPSNGPSRVNNEFTDPVPGPSNEKEMEETEETEETEKMINFYPSYSAVKVFENNEIEVFVQKSLHKRLKTFKMQDSLFNVKIKVKNNRTPPLIKDLLMVLDKAFYFILSNIRTFFKPDEENIVYMTLIQSPMVNGLNSAGFHLQDNSSNEIVDQVLNMLQRFLISDNNINLALNDTFKVYVHVLSVDHVQFKKRHPRGKQKNTRKKHYGASDILNHNNLKYVWAIDIPSGFENNENIFENKCLLMCIILGHLQNEFYKSNRKDRRFFYAKKINNKNKNERTYAGNILKKEMIAVLEALNLDNYQLLTLEEISKAMSEFYQCQIFLFDGIENSSKLKFMYPSQLQDHLEPIFLYEPFENKQHVILIKNLNSYFKANKKVCFQCRRTFKDSRYLHRCHRKTTCFACRRRFKTIATYSHEKLEPNFCDVNVNPNIKNAYCSLCNVNLMTEHCKKGHKLLCNGKGRFGWKCLKCKRFTCRYQNLTSNELKNRHKCGELVCPICKQYYDPKENNEIHLCLLNPETISKKWPSLAFIRFEFLNLNCDNCAECFEIKKLFQTRNNLDLKDVYEHKDFPTLFCENHLLIKDGLQPNLLIIYKEDKVKRGYFKRYILSTFLINQQEDNNYVFEYLKDITAPSCFIKKHKLKSLDFKKKIEQLHQDKRQSLMLSFFALLFSDDWSNTTFIIQDEDSISLVS
jgi:hypothetical protein